MNTLLKILLKLPEIIYFVLEAIVLSVVPKRFRYKDVSHELVLITGAGSGIGRELAKRFSKLGSRLVLLDIDAEGLKETASMIRNASVHFYVCDVSKREKVYELAAKIKKEAGTVYVLINNAGIITGKEFLELPDEMIQKTMDVNIMAHFWTCKAFLPDMIAANHGHIVSMASVAAIVAGPKLTDYCASKFAVAGFDYALRTELYRIHECRVKTTIVLPFTTNTGIFDGFEMSWMKNLSVEYLADEIVSAILVEQQVLVVPKVFNVLAPLPAMLPHKAGMAVLEAIGVIDCMNNFKGRYGK